MSVIVGLYTEKGLATPLTVRVVLFDNLLGKMKKKTTTTTNSTATETIH